MAKKPRNIEDRIYTLEIRVEKLEKELLKAKENANAAASAAQAALYVANYG